MQGNKSHALMQVRSLHDVPPSEEAFCITTKTASLLRSRKMNRCYHTRSRPFSFEKRKTTTNSKTQRHSKHTAAPHTKSTAGRQTRPRPMKQAPRACLRSRASVDTGFVEIDQAQPTVHTYTTYTTTGKRKYS